MRSWIAVLVAALTAAIGMGGLSTAYAQVDDDVIVVTGARIKNLDTEDAGVPVIEAGGPPYVSLVVPADFVVFTVTLETSTISLDARAKELETSFKLLADRVAKAKDIRMEVGAPGDSSPLETVAAKEGIVRSRDRSSIPIVLKFATQKGDTFGAVRLRAEKFIAEIPVNGRVEAIAGDQQYIGVSEPRKHREALLRKIADDAKLLQMIFAAGPGGSPAISLTGLEGRVKYRPSGPMEVEMYIPYAIVLGSPQPPR